MNVSAVRWWHLPQLCAILHSARSGRWWHDAPTLWRALLRGWVRGVWDAHGLAGFSLRKGADLHALYVHPRARGQGFGQVLLRDAQAHSPALDLWVARDNAGGRRFYTRHGFAEKSRSNGGLNEEGLAEILMVWPPERRVEP